MTELEQHLLSSLEKLEGGIRADLSRSEAALQALSARVAALETHAPELQRLCDELERVLRRLSSATPAP